MYVRRFVMQSHNAYLRITCHILNYTLSIGLLRMVMYGLITPEQSMKSHGINSSATGV